MDGQRDAAYVTEMEFDSFGRSVTALDFNGDGFWDVAVGAAYNDKGAYAAGRIYLYLGGPTLDTNADLRFDGTEAQDSLGEWLALLAPRTRPGPWADWRGRP
jgi:hypothetical protein